MAERFTCVCLKIRLTVQLVTIILLYFTEIHRSMSIPIQTPVSLIIFGLAGSFQVGFHASVYNQPQAVMENFLNSSYIAQYGKTPSKKYITISWSFIISCYAIGAVFADFFAQYLMDKCGRKGTLCLTASCGIIGSSLQALSYVFNRYQLLVVGRLLVGMAACTGNCAQVVFFSEIAPTKIRGLAGASVHVMAVVATIIANILGLPLALGTANLWPYLHVVAVLVPLLCLTTARWFPESPKSLAVNQNRDDLALRSLAFYNGADADIDGLLETIHAEAKEEDFATSKWRIINLWSFMRTNKSYHSVAVCFLALNLSIPFCGYYIMLTYAVQILQRAGLTAQVAHLAALSYCFVNLIAACIGLWAIDRKGRRKMVLVGIWVTFVCLILIFMCQTAMQISSHVSATLLSVLSISAVLTHASGKASLVCAVDALRGELFPSFIRASTVIYAGNLWLDIANVVITFAYLPMERMIGSWALLIVLILPLLTTGVIITKLCPETKGKHVSRIVQEIREMEKPAAEDTTELVQ